MNLRLAMYRGLRRQGWSRRKSAWYAMPWRNRRSFKTIREAMR